MLDEERSTHEGAPLRAAGYMRERERTSAGSTMDDLPAGPWFAPRSARSAVVLTDPDADTELLARYELRAEPPEDADAGDAWDALDLDTAFGPHGLETGILARLAKALEAGGMPTEAIAGHLTDLAEIRGWLDAPLWQMTVEQADVYFGPPIAWHEYPALLRQAQALTRYFAYLAGPDGALARERAHTAALCPLDALNWPTPADLVRDADPHQRAEQATSAIAPAD
jgi:hypothetical protein